MQCEVGGGVSPAVKFPAQSAVEKKETDMQEKTE